MCCYGYKALFTLSVHTNAKNVLWLHLHVLAQFWTRKGSKENTLGACKNRSRKNDPQKQPFFQNNFLEDINPFMGPLILLYGLLVMSILVSKPELACIVTCMQWILQVHLLTNQHGSRTVSIHINIQAASQFLFWLPSELISRPPQETLTFVTIDTIPCVKR